MSPSPPPNSPPAGKKFYLFGYPIAHSAAPALHGACFKAWGVGALNTYELWSSSKVTEDLLKVLSSDDFGGSAVTMPLKTDMLSYLDEISPESRITGACNTIVRVPTPTGFKLVGQNTDILGVRNALLRGVRMQFPKLTIPSEVSYPACVRGAGLVIGGGATTRSAAHALTLLGLSPIFLINRDVGEVRAVQVSLPHLTEKGSLIHLRNPDDVEKHLAQPDSVRILMIVGAIPSFAPITPEERMVYTTVSSVLTIPYNKPTEVSEALPVPNKRLFLEMAYKPRSTPMLQVAIAHGWHGIDGVQAMIEQGLAQQRMWYTSTPTLEVGSDQRILGHADLPARNICENMGDVAVVGSELDRAAGKGPARRR
ncbi:hypothetical protein BDZ94DRAFT_1230489 [Collybia nuda]|uniref:Shikimate dehydrogenase substrate binding N-terminal domain-containing protein n=1 Tax=Collybia nuda TaxID=64659 RepID=A0A9P5XUQ8_9AGAR|nr:hypothetical protein BDZ94DRAFT_1230489 [Collybia nuda]